MKTIKYIYMMLLMFGINCLYGKTINNDDLPQEEQTRLLRLVFEKWQGQEGRIKQLIYESSLSDKPMDYYNGDDCVATFYNNTKTVLTYLEPHKKMAVGLTYEHMLVIAGDKDDVGEENRDPSHAIIDGDKFGWVHEMRHNNDTKSEL
jgi:hypothetical protein